jgi:hypothetical protein
LKRGIAARSYLPSDDRHRDGERRRQMKFGAKARGRTAGDHRIAWIIVEVRSSRADSYIGAYQERATHCGATTTTSYALRRDDDNMYCGAARTSYFILLSSLRLVGAQYPLHVLARRGTWGAVGDKEGQSHEIPRDSAGVLDCALQSFTIVLSAVSRSDYRRDEIAAREHE